MVERLEVEGFTVHQVIFLEGMSGPEKDLPNLDVSVSMFSPSSGEWVKIDIRGLYIPFWWIQSARSCTGNSEWKPLIGWLPRGSTVDCTQHTMVCVWRKYGWLHSKGKAQIRTMEPPLCGVTVGCTTTLSNCRTASWVSFVVASVNQLATQRYRLTGNS